MNYKQFLTTKTELPTDLIDKILDFWIEYDPEIHTWYKVISSGDNLDDVKLLLKYNIDTEDSKWITFLAAFYRRIKICNFFDENKNNDIRIKIAIQWYDKVMLSEIRYYLLMNNYYNEF